ncbi:unnamed protein product [Prunus armeniaca]
MPKEDTLPRCQAPAETPDCQSSQTAKPNSHDTCHHRGDLHKVPHRKSTPTSHFHFPIKREQYPSKRAQLAPSPIRPRRLFFTPHSAMPTEDSQGTQHHIPHGGTSQRRPSADANLQAELESLRASVTRMSEKYDHLHAKNVELEHDFRTLKRNWEMNQTQGSQHSQTSRSTPTTMSQPSLGPARVKAPSIRKRPSRGFSASPRQGTGPMNQQRSTWIAGTVSWTVKRNPLLSLLISKTQR